MTLRPKSETNRIGQIPKKLTHGGSFSLNYLWAAFGSEDHLSHMNSHPLRPVRRSLSFMAVLYHNLQKCSSELIVNYTQGTADSPSAFFDAQLPMISSSLRLFDGSSE